VVDDEAYNTEVLEMIIASLGFPKDKIKTCLSGKEALEILQESMFLS